MERRTLLIGAGLLLAGCVGPDLGAVGPGKGDSSSVAAYLASMRSAKGLQPLLPDPVLEDAAKQQARYMAGADKMNHTARWGKSFARRMADAGINVAAAENIAYGQRNHAAVMESWMNSPSHRRNMLNPAYSRFGLASAANTNGRLYWAMVLSA